MSTNNGPQFVRFFSPVIMALQELGGSGTAAEVSDRVIEKLGIPDEDLQETTSGGQPKVVNQIGWARFYLVKADFIDASQRGVWSLTRKGQAGLSESEALPLFREIAKGFRKTSKKRPVQRDPGEGDGDESPDSDGLSLLETLQALPPEGFERVCQRLLRESGFKQVEVTGKSGDGGIDGNGILEVNPLVSFNVLFQCKRYQGSVSSSQVRDFRGAMLGRADKGIILTTGSFTSEAKKEARRDGAPPIELVNGERLVEMFERAKLGVVPRIVFEVDQKFFDEYR